MPKPLVQVCGKPILEHIIDALPPEIDEIVLVVSYKAEMIQQFCGSEFKGRRIRYAFQENPKAGTADALLQARGMVSGKFLVMYADDIHGASSLAEVIQTPAGMLAARSDTPEKFGVLVLNDDGSLNSIIEKPEVPPSNLVNIGGFVLTPEIFDIELSMSELGEYLLTDSVSEYARKYPMTVVEQSLWLPIGYPEHIGMAEAVLCPR
jgi:NDP-sugar pyrophosphorylase family protein